MNARFNHGKATPFMGAVECKIIALLLRVLELQGIPIPLHALNELTTSKSLIL